ncbi:annexin A2-like isoform X1 [Acipenser ruthenus]|uniref:annexin A2-like isoform X1 n=1 Tax=Acipenser ruthenus TaxID=7906 RepID=UPI0027427B9D|nr:annexin A2-like isoform X1 [Acipenser ruthenus]
MQSINELLLSKVNEARKPTVWGTLGTIRPFPNFDPEMDAVNLVAAIKSKDTGAIVQILTNRSSTQRQLIARLYRTTAAQDLLSDLQGALSGDLKSVIVGLMRTPSRFDATELRRALKGIGTDEDTLIEILCTRDNKQLHEIITAYKQEFNRDLEQDIADDTSKDFQRLLLALAKGTRENNTDWIDYRLIDHDAKTLYEAKANSKTPNPDPWIQILTERSTDHLDRVFQKYIDYSSEEIEKTIQTDFSGDLGNALLSLVSAIQNTPLYLAGNLQEAMKRFLPVSRRGRGPRPSSESWCPAARRPTQHPGRVPQEIRSLSVHSAAGRSEGGLPEGIAGTVSG